MKRNTYAYSLLIPLIYLFFIGFPYFLVSYQYDGLINRISHQVTLHKADVDKMFYMYTSEKIDINKSLWGKYYQLKRSEYCQQYLILWIEPIDIVYSWDHRVIAVFSSFE